MALPHFARPCRTFPMRMTGASVFKQLGLLLAFIFLTLKHFHKNQGILLAGAIAYYALLSIVPFLILTVIALSHLVSRAQLLGTLGRYLEWLVPSQSLALLADLNHFLENGAVIGVVLFFTMLFFSSLAFSVLEKSMAIIFTHRGAVDKRHFLTAALIPYCLVFFLGTGLLIVTLISINLEAMGLMSINVLQWHWSLGGLSRALLYLLGLGAETIILSAIYYFIPVGRTAPLQAFIGGLFTACSWEIIRHLLVWYLSTMSSASIVYGSLTTAVLALFSMEIIATLLLLGAQVIAEYEQRERPVIV
jgi:membrane protein